MTRPSVSSQGGAIPRLAGPALMFFIRHGQTDWNAEGRMQGRQDIPLNATGKAQAQDNGRRLKTFLEDADLSSAELDFIASPLGRTRQTMELVRTQVGLPHDHYRQDPRLLELTFGDWEGHTLEELAASDPDRVERRSNDKWGFVPPNGESYEMLVGRTADWLASLENPTVIVSHGGVYRVVRALLEGTDPQVAAKLHAPQDQIYLWRNGRPDWI